ncbi:Biopolymer transport protein ExbD/TolR [Rubripirellula lacrimiformis]|uniref:Biopolymer transport protein ExbD/TolR n=1 Tax=Rubripirellula lacrimiformis TaxID=1930273 RepID=A0A517N5M5_9BACT|nr:biopolymer transporter ExbD [Rubripirellula lacrimiformis]QDT02439.1 Biopolymer transport protein ExbD/TolR [Rubripirellula lacrimiformis]
MSTDLDDIIEEEEDDFVLPRKNRDDDEMDITPMIDITFLLLIFFVVCSTMDPTKIGTIPEAENGLAIAAKNSAVIFINPGSGDTVILNKMDGSEFSRDEDAQASEIIEYITSELERSLGASKQQVMLFGDANVKVGQVTRIQKIIGDAFEDIDSTYIAVKEN